MRFALALLLLALGCDGGRARELQRCPSGRCCVFYAPCEEIEGLEQNFPETAGRWRLECAVDAESDCLCSLPRQ